MIAAYRHMATPSQAEQCFRDANLALLTESRNLKGSSP